MIFLYFLALLKMNERKDVPFSILLPCVVGKIVATAIWDGSAFGHLPDCKNESKFETNFFIVVFFVVRIFVNIF